MAITLPHIEDSNTTLYFPPKGEFETFTDESHYEEKVREWGLSTTKEVKREFWYKERTHQRLVRIKGYEIYGDTNEGNTIVIEFQDGNLSCIHPAYLKEMQSPSFTKGVSATDQTPALTSSDKQEKPVTKETEKSETKEQKKKTAIKDKQPKIELPEDKVHFTAVVKQLALSWNNFNEENDEVVVLENVVIQQENPIEVGLAWCSHTKTLKKYELQPNDTLEFDGKIVKKRLPKGKDVEDESLLIDVPVPYKVNNPSKIMKS
ncbi:hypothetical protein [Bacillus sp. Marseille-P3661]|uniref:hypothetical protein n=1 Tax=Bacillus sp. Marseille-P3661 TaxID=1936234 RepID=UPI0015E197FA|nr:hypothetical protein [Bacillus sp. Marseille-P3661]